MYLTLEFQHFSSVGLETCQKGDYGYPGCGKEAGTGTKTLTGAYPQFIPDAGV